MIRLCLTLILIGSSTFALAIPLRTEGVLPADKPLLSTFDKAEGSVLEKGDEVIRALMLTGHYQRVSTYQDASGQLLVSAVPIRKIEKVEVEGVKSFSKSEILKMTGLSAGDRFERNKAVQGGEKIKAFYGENGFYNAIVEVEFRRQKNGDQIVHFQIDEKAPCRIIGFSIQSENPLLQKKLEDSLRSYKGKTLSEELRVEIQKSINDHLSEQHYLRAEIKNFEVQYDHDHTSVTMIYTISDPYRYEIIPKGIRRVTLGEFFQNLNLAAFERTNLDPVVSITEKTRAYYLNKGFAHVQVRSEVEDVPRKFLRKVKILVNEGPLTTLSSLVVTGRISKSPSFYSSFIVDSSSHLVQLGYYNRQDLETGTKNLLTDLKNHGFLKARALSTRVEFSPDKRKAFVEVILDEGPLTQVRQVDFEGVKAFSPLELSEAIPIKANQPLRLNEVDQSLEALRRFYFSRGYLEMKVLNPNDQLIEYNDRGTQAQLHFRIYEGPKIRVGRIVVEGNTFTQSDVVTREINIHEGDILTYDKIDESTIRLNKFGIFSRVEIKTLEENSNVSNRTLVVSVTERDPGVFRYGAGVNSSRGFSVRGFTGLSYNNILGTARGLNTRVELNYNVSQVHFLENKIAAGYFEPFMFGTRTRGRVNVSRSQYVFFYDPNYQSPIESQPQGPFTVLDTSNKIEFLLEREITKRIRLTWTALGIDSQSTYERSGENHGNCISPDPNPAKSVCSNELQVNYIGPTIDLDFRDSPFMPTRGHYARLDAMYADPNFGSTPGVRFMRSEATYSHYYPINNSRWIWTNSVRGGYESSFLHGNKSGIPASYAFFLGGYNTIRGFETTNNLERIPPNYDLNFTYPNQFIVTQDSSYYLFKTELRFPIVGDFGGVIFYDGGGVQVTGVHFHRPYRHSVGIGLRINTPVGPASLDVAFKLNPIDQDLMGVNGLVHVKEEPFRIHFYIGTF